MVSLKYGLHFTFLEAFLNQLWVGSFGTSIRSKIETKDIQSIRFCFKDPIREWIDPYEFANELGLYRIKEESPVFEAENRYYVVTAVARSKSISIIAQDRNNKTVDVKSHVTPLIDASANVSTETFQDLGITFKGQEKLVFGVELYELVYNINTKRFRMKWSEEPVMIRGEEKLQQVIKPSFIGEKEDIFITVD